MIDGMLKFISLEPQHGEEFWDAFSDLCLMWPRCESIISTDMTGQVWVYAVWENTTDTFHEPIIISSIRPLQNKKSFSAATCAKVLLTNSSELWNYIPRPGFGSPFSHTRWPTVDPKYGPIFGHAQLTNHIVKKSRTTLIQDLEER
jgi:hypothetical protein